MPLILAVDDSLDSIVFLQEFLLKNGYDCRLASSESMAMDLISLEHFDLMEEGDGIWLLKELKNI